MVGRHLGQHFQRVEVRRSWALGHVDQRGNARAIGKLSKSYRGVIIPLAGGLAQIWHNASITEFMEDFEQRSHVSIREPVFCCHSQDLPGSFESFLPMLARVELLQVCSQEGNFTGIGCNLERGCERGDSFRTADLGYGVEHRGTRRRIPENVLAAFTEIEFDILRKKLTDGRQSRGALLDQFLQVAFPLCCLVRSQTTVFGLWMN